jgi:polyisoprenoid-binding protein YceI
MKSLLLSIVFITFVACSTTVAQTKQINTSSSLVNWVGYKVTGKHNGDIKVKSGNLKFNGDVLTGGEVIIDMTSINCTDLSGNGKASLEGHLKSDDFFGSANFPASKLVFTKVISRGKPGEYKIVGNLTIKNTTKEIKFDAVVSANTATADIKIDRTDYDVRYGSGSFFDNLGDKTIYDEFDLNVKLVF